MSKYRAKCIKREQVKQIKQSLLLAVCLGIFAVVFVLNSSAYHAYYN